MRLVAGFIHVPAQAEIQKKIMRDLEIILHERCIVQLADPRRPALHGSRAAIHVSEQEAGVGVAAKGVVRSSAGLELSEPERA